MLDSAFVCARRSAYFGLMMLVLMLIAFAASAEVTTTESTSFSLMRGSSIHSSASDLEDCRAKRADAIAEEAKSRFSGSATYRCILTDAVVATFKPDPVQCPEAPTETREATCAEGQIGEWTQSRFFIAAPSPECWLPSDQWDPVTPPPGECVTPPPPPPADSDRDGVPDASDKCPNVAASTPDGCPVVEPPPHVAAKPVSGKLSGKAVSATVIELTWEAATDADGIARYSLEGCCDSSTCTPRGISSRIEALTYRHTVPAGATCRYRHRAVDKLGNYSTHHTPISVSATPVTPMNRAPTISGTPATTATVGSAYTFTPSASDPDGDALSLSITNKPAWANFETATGRLSGTPTASGTHNGIAITASDGKASASLSAFSITVVSLSDGTATLTWTPPTQKVDGSALTNLSGFRVLWGSSASSLTNSELVDVPRAKAWTVKNLPPGTHFFAVTARTSDGMESALSNVVSKPIQ